jgi:D-glycero-D-manno-heptose 1,7-bisphosphate phosphatase
MIAKQKAIFIDKDGTLIVDVPYNVDPAKIVLSDDCTKGLRDLQAKEYLLVVISNQSGVARGYFKEEALQLVERQIKTMLAGAGIRLDGFYYCPHYPEGDMQQYVTDCDCRKPEPGMLFKASDELNIDLLSSWMVGDILNDVEAGNRAGCKTILIDNGNETEWLFNIMRTPWSRVKTINEAAEYILKQDGK